MPNWVKNIIHMEGSAEDIARVKELIQDNDHPDKIDFNAVIPMPERLKITAGGYDRKYVALYLNTLNDGHKDNLRRRLATIPVSYYGTYLKKYEESFTMDISDDQLTRMREALTSEYKDFSPNRMEDIGKLYIDNILEYGADSWYDWCCEHWGTKWNGFRTKFTESGFEFETAWDAPFPIIEELSRRFPDLIFHHQWADENIGYNCGMKQVKGGETLLEFYPEIASDEGAKTFAWAVWGYDTDEMEDD